MVRMALALGATSALGGCATFANGSAAALPGYVYVVGQINSAPAIWLCPADPGKGDCTPVDVTIEDEE